MGVQINNLEVDTALYCNLRCSHCTHAAPYEAISGDTQLSTPLANGIVKTITSIEHLSTIANIQVLRIVGGEPLLSPATDELCRHVASNKLVNKISLFTNGALLLRRDAKDQLFADINDLRVSLYLSASHSVRILKRLRLIKEANPHLDIQFNRITYFTKFNLQKKTEDVELVQKIYDNCIYSSGEGLNLHFDKLYRCFASWRKARLLYARGVLTDDSFYNNANDMLVINQNTTSDELSQFIHQTTPVQACSYCLGCSGKPFKHHQISSHHLHSREDIATIETDLDFEQGRSYLSNLLYSWARNDTESLNHTKFYDSKYLKDYFKWFGQSNAEALEIESQTEVCD